MRRHRSQYGGIWNWMTNRRNRPAGVVARTPSVATASSVYRINNRIKRLESGGGKELKTHDTEDLGTIGTTADIQCLTQTVQGNTSLSREGLEIRPKYLRWKLFTTLHASATFTLCRLIIFADTENTGVYPTVGQILEAASVIAWKEHDTRPRFKFYKDITYYLDDVKKKTALITGTIKFGKKAKIWYKGVTAEEISNGKNAIFILMISDDNTNQPGMNFISRLRFTE